MSPSIRQASRLSFSAGALCLLNILTPALSSKQAREAQCPVPVLDTERPLLFFGYPIDAFLQGQLLPYPSNDVALKATFLARGSVSYFCGAGVADVAQFSALSGTLYDMGNLVQNAQHTEAARGALDSLSTNDAYRLVDLMKLHEVGSFEQGERLKKLPTNEFPEPPVTIMKMSIFNKGYELFLRASVEKAIPAPKDAAKGRRFQTVQRDPVDDGREFEGVGAVDWQFMKGENPENPTLPASMGEEAYMISTVGGKAPDECGGIDDYITGPFIAQFWVYRLSTTGPLEINGEHVQDPCGRP